MAQRVNAVAWWAGTILALSMLGAIGLLFVRLRRYWIVKYRGVGARMRGAQLPGAPLAAANLYEADLSNSNLRHANLEGAVLDEASLAGADLTGAKLNFAHLYNTDLHGADLTGVKLGTLLWYVDLRQARGLDQADLSRAVDYGENVWPKGFDPRERGIIVLPVGEEPMAVYPPEPPLELSGSGRPR
jgi:hypothetical protein